jgi:hypothetical protein
MRKIDVLWFSRQAPTKEQKADLATTGRRIVALDKGMALAELDPKDRVAYTILLSKIRRLAKREGASEVYGVFATSIQSVLTMQAVTARLHPEEDAVDCYGFWEENGAHREFLWVGVL